MDACHLLLGWPWQYDRSVIYDGRRNTYTLSIRGKKVVLAPQREVVTHASVIEKGTNLLSMSQFLKEAEEEGVVYILMPCKEGAIINDEVSVKLQEVLTEFTDLMPENLPPSLPPMRDIQHHIDLVPGSSLPNRLAYRLSLKESEELQRQVT